MTHTNITQQPCPFVDCGSSDAFSYNTRGFGKCFSCNESYPSKKTVFSWSQEKYPLSEGQSLPSIQDAPVVEISDYTTSGKYVSMRGLSVRTMEKYDVTTTSDKSYQTYTYPSGGRKMRNLKEKDFRTTKGFTTDEFFGMDKFTAGCSKVLTITEGELDALSVYQMLTDLDSSRLYPVVSMPSATPAKAIWEKCKPYLDSFDKLVLSFDNDEAGNAIADKVAKLFPNKVYRVPHGKYKDANDFLTNRAQNEFKQAWYNAKKYTPDNVLNTTEQFMQLYNDTPEFQYVPTGINELDAKILGLMQGHFTVIKAPRYW